MMSERIVSLLVGCSILGAVATVLFVIQGSGSEPVVRSEPRASPSSETVPEAAKILYAQLASLHRQQSGSQVDAREVALQHSLGRVFEDSGNYPQASKHFSLARDQAAQLGDSFQIVAIQTTLGSMHAKFGHISEGRKQLESAFLLMDRSGPNAFATMRALANVRRDSGKVEEALTLYKEILQLQEPQGSSTENVAGILSDMGEAYYSKGQLDVAMSHYEQALDKVTGSKSPPTTGTAAHKLAGIYRNMGQALHEKGDIEKAGEYYRKALRLQQRTLRANHPCITETLTNLARLERDSGAGIDVALATISKAEVLLKGRETHREFANILMVKADFFREAQRLEEAEATAIRALNILESLTSEETPELAVNVNGLGSILHDQHKYQDAVKQYMRALTINMKTVGSNHPETAATYNNLGNVYQDAGDDGAAERYYRKTLEIQKTIYTNDTPDTAATYNNIATILVRHGRLAEAKELLMKAVNIVEKAGLPPGSPERAIYEENLREVEVPTLHQVLAGVKQEHEAQIV